MSKADIAQAIITTAELMGQNLSDPAVKMFTGILASYPEEAVLKALLKCTTEMKGRKLTPAEVIERIDDGRPGPQEAWGQIPTGEDQTVVWTEEMATAHAAAAPLMHRDKIAARQTFIEVYTKELAKARGERKQIRWKVSNGTDHHQRETALREAVEQGKLTIERARHYLPFGNFTEATPALSHHELKKLAQQRKEETDETRA